MTEADSEFETDDVFEGLAGQAYLATFTARIPFLVGVPDDLGHTISSPDAGKGRNVASAGHCERG